MNREIERKFLVRQLPPEIGDFPGFFIEQGYIAIEPGGAIVRIRKKGDQATLTIKRGTGRVREEHEIELTLAQFNTLWPLTAGRRLSKRRHEIPYAGRKIEMDIYSGVHTGLIVAEVEFESEEAAQEFVPPEWFGEDVSERPEYSNSSLARE